MIGTNETVIVVIIIFFKNKTI